MIMARLLPRRLVRFQELAVRASLAIFANFASPWEWPG
jgi:hypothetical protein